MTNPTLDFKFLRGISQILAWFLNSYVGNDKSCLGFRIPSWDFTNPRLVFKFQRGKSKILRWTSATPLRRPEAAETREERPTHGHAIGLLNSAEIVDLTPE